MLVGLQAYMEEKFKQLKVDMLGGLAEIDRRISQLEDIVQAKVAVKSHVVTSVGDEAVSNL